MKSIKEIIPMLLHELDTHVKNLQFTKSKKAYYNEDLGDTSFLLGGLLELLLKKNFYDWEKNKWIDDSLITKVEKQNDGLTIDGIMIWGIENTTKQWTDPFSFKIDFIKRITNHKAFTFLFCDLNNPEITYEEFRDNREHWSAEHRDWKYTINSNEVKL